jgi:hypothetical protein
MENPRLKEKVSVEELLTMFGQVGEENGKPFIFAQEAQGEEHTRFRDTDQESDDMGNED